MRAAPKPVSRRSGPTGGFALIYAVMVSTIVVAVGLSVISIALKQLAISTLGRESSYAFYAANTGAECALYWDFHGYLETSTLADGSTVTERKGIFMNPFTSGREISDAQGQADPGGVECARSMLMENISCATPEFEPDDTWCEQWEGADQAVGQTSFTVFLGRSPDTGEIDPSGACARVTVEKVRYDYTGGEFATSSAGESLLTRVDARGYNYCDPDNPRQVERGLRFTY